MKKHKLMKEKKRRHKWEPIEGSRMDKLCVKCYLWKHWNFESERWTYHTPDGKVTYNLPECAFINCTSVDIKRPNYNYKKF